jgi:thiol-disulfide isomerase/thioredoxin
MARLWLGCRTYYRTVYMKYWLLGLLLLVGTVSPVFAADGYRIQVKLTDTKDTMVSLARYYGKPLPTIYKLDSARIDKNGAALLQGKDKITGGIYIIILSDNASYMEVLLNNGDDISITASAKDMAGTAKYKNSPENERFMSYTGFLKEYAAKQVGYKDELKAAKTKEDSAAIMKRASADGKAVGAYRKAYINQYPKTLLAQIFSALEMPTVPEGKHMLTNGKEDSSFAYNYYKQHYWDNFDFQDDRLIHTPIFDSRLDNYFNNVVVHMPDSVNYEADVLLAKMEGTQELFKYTLHWLTKFAQDSKVMGMDEVFVYLVENYHMKGKATWLSSSMLDNYIDKARKIAPNVLGNIAPDINMVDINRKEQTLHGINAKYTLLIFWSPECGSCRTEIPKVDSLYKSVLKGKGVKVYAVRTDGDEKLWQETIAEFKLADWTHVYDPEHKSNYKAQYDVYGTPKLFLLDDKKIIRGKKLDHTNITQVIDMLEKQHN